MAARYAFGAGIDEPLAAYRGAASAYYEADGLGSITSLTGLSGSVSDNFVYDSFGNLSNSSGTFVQPFRYTGREYDVETALFYYRAIYYDPSIGRFLSEDSNKDGVAGSLFMHVENSPVQLIDPFGTQAQPGLFPGPKNTPQQTSQFNAGFAEAMNRLKNSECRKLFCRKNKNLDPAKALQDTEYRIVALDNNSAGAATMSPTFVFLDPNGPFFQTSTEVFIPYDNPQLIGKRLVKFDSLAELDAFILLHELGHQVGIFPADLFSLD
jgi:RHS repeat-associated protein